MNHNIRRYSLRAALIDGGLELAWSSDPSNPPRRDGARDHRFGDEAVLYPEPDEEVHVSIADFEHEGRPCKAAVIAINGRGDVQPWERLPGGSASPPMASPERRELTFHFDLVVVAAAAMNLNPDLAAAPAVRTAKCPVKVVFITRLG